MRNAIRYLWTPVAHVLWYAYTVVLGTVALVVWPFERTGVWQHALVRFWCWLVMRTVFVRIRVRGAGHVPPQQACVFVANHASFLDIPALFAALPYPFRTMAKRELFWLPIIGWHMRACGHFPVDRGDARRAAATFRRVVTAVRGGTSVALFPEGTRTPDGRLQPMADGAFKIAIHAGAPIIPVAISGTFALMPRGGLMPRPGEVEVIIGAPIDTAPYSGKNVTELIAKAGAVIEAGLR